MAIGDSLANPYLWVDNTNSFNATAGVGALDDRYVSLPLRKGVSYTFVISGTFGAFDPELRLYDTLDNGQALLAVDDNSFGGLEPMITPFVCPVTGIYYLHCERLGAGSGNFFFLALDNDSVKTITYYRTRTTNVVAEFIQRHIVRTTNVIRDFLVIRTKLTTNTFNFLDVHRILTTNQFNINSINRATGGNGGNSGGGWKIWSKSGYEIFANGVLLGYLPDGVFTLTDVALANGDYEIVAKPLGNFYRDTEVRQSIRIQTTGTVTELFPLINDLVTVIDNMRTYIGWSIVSQFLPTTTKIGLWFGVGSGIVITGTPDVSIPISTLMVYKYSFRQVTSQWVAVACYDGAARGTKVEIELPWSTALPDSPEYQHIE